jgi:TniQ protein
MTATHGNPPLPCSLDPLPDESLPGFLLRLSHRLELPPLRLLQLTGLAPLSGARGWGPRGMMMRLSTVESERFARATRLTVAEVGDLCLERLAPRYPWSIPLATTDRSGPRLVTNAWVFTTATRYCPACLSGDGSVIQNLHAGAWRQRWRLPIVFACLRHERVLEHLCPACAQPALSAPPGAVPRLVPRMGVAGLHPAQCRSSHVPAPRGYGRNPQICGTRLDQISDLTAQPAPALNELLALQQRLDALIDPTGPATTTSAGAKTTIPRYLTDLRMTCALVTATWPASRGLLPIPGLADDLGRYLGTTGSGPRRFSEYDAPPLDPRACAALICAAVATLDAPDLRALSPLLAADGSGPKSPRNRWIRRYQRIGDQCSDGLQAALEPLTHSFGRVDQKRHGRRAPARRIAFGPQHIPEQLEDAWFHQHFRQFERPRPRLLRRAAALSLVQMAAGGSLREAAAFLGIDERYVAPGRGTNVAAAAYRADGADPVEFRLAVRALAKQLNSTTDLVDYKHRRDALHNWYIDEPTWQDIVDHLPHTKGPFHPEISNCKRQFASEVVWTRITHGEHILAPRVIEQQHAGNDPTWGQRRANMWHFYLADPPKPHYADLRLILNELADHLATEIDQLVGPRPHHAPIHSRT